MSEILERWTQRLMNWALWRMAGASYSGGCAYDGEWGQGAPRPPLPLVGEALDTEALVQRLSDTHQEAVIATYVWTVPETLQERADVLEIHRDTLADRVVAAKYQLDDMHSARKRACTKLVEGLRPAV